jgi:hypothetical protein
MFAAPTSPAAPSGNGSAGNGPGDEPPATEDGLPRRVRQASLAPQLRRPAGAPPVAEEAAPRSPEQMRSIMSALQRGTTRGRIDAARYGPDPTGPGPVGTENDAENGTPSAGAVTASADAAVAGADSGHGNRAHTPEVGADSVSEERSNPHSTDDAVQSDAPSFADAATVSFPAIVNLALARDEASSGAGTNAAGDRADDPERNDVTRPDKDA